MKYKAVISMITVAALSIGTADDLNEGKDPGTVSAKVKAMHVIHDKNNGYTPNDGSGYLFQLNYKSPDLLTKNLKVGIGMYVNGDTGLTEWDKADKKPARGMFVAPKGKETAQLGEAYLSYKNQGSVRLKLGRQTLNTPMTTIKWSLMPNFYEAYGIGSEAVKDLSLDLMQITRISYGSRTVADWKLIGESTGSAGAPNVLEEKGGIGQAHFIPVRDVAGVDSSAGLTAFGMTYKGVKHLEVTLWDYYGDNIVNNFYTDAVYKLPLSESLKMTLSAQYLNQQSLNDFINPYTRRDIDFWLAGAKAVIETKIWNVYAAYNQSTDSDQMYNVYGSDPAYTSSLFSRNQYRRNVKAYKVGGSYEIIKGLKALGSYANYGKSKTVNLSGWVPTTDAYEIDVWFKYKPDDTWSLILCNTIRSSEYDGCGDADRTQEHVRVIASYTF